MLQATVSGGNTITAKSASYTMLMKRLRNKAGYLLKLTRTILFQSKTALKTGSEVRKRIETVVTNQTNIKQFLDDVKTAEPDLELVIQWTILCAIRLTCMPEIFRAGCDESSPEGCGQNVMPKLFEFVLRLCSERPILVLEEDDDRGSHVTFLQESMESYIAECLEINKRK